MVFLLSNSHVNNNGKAFLNGNAKRITQMPCHPENVENEGICQYGKQECVGFLYTFFSL
jgi:hypothetical protein